MTTKEKLKNLIDQLPEEKLNLIEPFLRILSKENKPVLPKGNLGLKESFNRASLYEEILANRY